MARLFLVLVAAVVVIVVWLTGPSTPEVLPPTPASLCSSTDRETASVIRTFEGGDVEVTPCTD
ncbi:hypothetical protein [Pseudonocardia sp. NPDC049154]|uniref:hypothetical protein n=1 Tax=Pseudonocardia sp. NPDC049154 TaxID=3155501 RepID=UPI0033F0CB12